MSDKKKEKSAAPKKEKKDRKPREKIPTYKESPAGHMAGRLMLLLNSIKKMRTKVLGWEDGNISYNHMQSAENELAHASLALTTLHGKGFKPEKKKGGGLKLTPGQQVWLREEAVKLLSRDMPTQIAALIAQGVYVSRAYDGVEKAVPCKATTGDIDKGTFLGRISKKLLSTTPV